MKKDVTESLLQRDTKPTTGTCATTRYLVFVAFGLLLLFVLTSRSGEGFVKSKESKVGGLPPLVDPKLSEITQRLNELSKMVEGSDGGVQNVVPCSGIACQFGGYPNSNPQPNSPANKPQATSTIGGYLTSLKEKVPFLSSAQTNPEPEPKPPLLGQFQGEYDNPYKPANKAQDNASLEDTKFQLLKGTNALKRYKVNPRCRMEQESTLDNCEEPSDLLDDWDKALSQAGFRKKDWASVERYFCYFVKNKDCTMDKTDCCEIPR